MHNKPTEVPNYCSAMHTGQRFANTDLHRQLLWRCVLQLFDLTSLGGGKNSENLMSGTKEVKLQAGINGFILWKHPEFLEMRSAHSDRKNKRTQTAVALVQSGLIKLQSVSPS